MPRATKKRTAKSYVKRFEATIGGLPVKNITKPILLSVSPTDCKLGNKKAPGSCAAALAAVRQIPNCVEARIHIGRVFFLVNDGNKKYWLRGKTPNALRTEIATFDRGGTFEPGEFKINPLSASELADHHPVSHKPVKNKKPNSKKLPTILHNVRTNAHSEYGYKVK